MRLIYGSLIFVHSNKVSALGQVISKANQRGNIYLFQVLPIKRNKAHLQP